MKKIDVNLNSEIIYDFLIIIYVNYFYLFIIINIIDLLP